MTAALQESHMSRKILVVASLIALAGAALALPIAASAASPDMKTLDPDSDGTVSFAEAKGAAATKFATLDVDKDGTIDTAEAKSVMSSAAFGKADPDKDGTIDKSEYMLDVEGAFKSADKDNDGTLDAKELGTPAGQTLLAMIQ